MMTLTRGVRQALKSIIREARAIQPARVEDDEQMYYLIGGIIANAEDALGALEAGRETAAFDAMMRGGFTVNGRNV